MQKCNQAQLLRVKRQLQECHAHKRRWEEEATHASPGYHRPVQRNGHGQRYKVFSDGYLLCLHTSDVVMWNNCMPETTTLHVYILQHVSGHALLHGLTISRLALQGAVSERSSDGRPVVSDGARTLLYTWE